MTDVVSEDGGIKTGWMPAGRGAWKEAGVPWTRRQTVQWQRWNGRGRKERGMVTVKWTDLQKQWAVTVRVAVGEEETGEVTEVMLRDERKGRGCSDELPENQTN